MPKKEQSTASSWWKRGRGKIMAMKTESKTEIRNQRRLSRQRERRKTEEGMSYICEICGCEMDCVSNSAGRLFAVKQPMMLIC